MLFEVSDLDRRRRTHVGVLEFNGPDQRPVTCPCGSCELLCADVGDRPESPLPHRLGYGLRVHLQQKARHVLA